MLTKVKNILICTLLLIFISSCSFTNNDKENEKKEIINGKGEKIEAVGGEIFIEKNIETSISNSGNSEVPTSKPQ